VSTENACTATSSIDAALPHALPDGARNDASHRKLFYHAAELTAKRVVVAAHLPVIAGNDRF
jgi:hypothetical protein